MSKNKRRYLCYKLNDFNLDTFSQDILDIFYSDDFQRGFIYYMSLTDTNGKSLNFPIQYPFLLKNLKYKNKLTMDLYNKIDKRIKKYDWELSKFYFFSRSKLGLAEYSDMLFIFFDSKKKEN
jgi:hypothetical protein